MPWQDLPWGNMVPETLAKLWVGPATGGASSKPLLERSQHVSAQNVGGKNVKYSPKREIVKNMLSGFKKQNLISMSRAIMTSNPQHFQLPKFQVPTFVSSFQRYQGTKPPFLRYTSISGWYEQCNNEYTRSCAPSQAIPFHVRTI